MRDGRRGGEVEVRRKGEEWGGDGDGEDEIEVGVRVPGVDTGEGATVHRAPPGSTGGASAPPEILREVL